MNDTIISLAVLKANWEAKKASYIDNFNVLTAECLKRSPEDVVSASAIRDALEERFGLQLPLRTVSLVLRRAAKTGLVYREHGVYHIDRAQVEKVNFEEYRSKFLFSYDRLIGDLIKYAEQKYSIKWSTENAEATLHDYLNTNSFTLLQAISKPTYVPLPKAATKNQRYIFASYVNSLVNQQSEHLDSLQVVLEGHMLATAIFLPDPSSTQAKFQKTCVFFDTRFLIYALGYAGGSLSAPGKELLEMLYGLGADLCCFDHTVDEIASILTSCANNLRTGASSLGYGPTFDYFFAKGFNESDVLLLTGRLEDDLRKIRVEIKAKPPYIKEHMIDEPKLEEFITSRVYYPNPYALKRDIDSISSIPRIRAGNQARLIERCVAIFVTSNSPLIEAVNEFVGTEEELCSAPLAISDWNITNLIWLKKPLKAPDLPRKRLIADCYAAVQPSDSFRKRYYEELEKLASREDYTAQDVYALRHSLEAQRIALDVTVGDEDAFTEGTVQEVLGIYHERIRSEEKKEREAAQAGAERLAEKIQTQTAEQEARIAQIETRAVTVARTLSGFALGFLVVLVATSLYFLIPSVTVQQVRVLRIPVRYVAFSLMCVLSLANWIWGTTLSRIRRHIEMRIVPYIEKVFKWMGGIA